jgi:hypothetical protein
MNIQYNFSQLKEQWIICDLEKVVVYWKYLMACQLP